MLAVKGVSKHFGGLAAVSGVSFDLGQEPITGLVGPNGSGKTTLFHLITGFYPMDRGEVLFAGRPIHGLPAHRISRLGLSRTFQHSRMLAFLSVRDNLLAAAPDQPGERLRTLFLRPGRVRQREMELAESADRILGLIRLDHLADQPAGRLSYGQQKLLELGRVLMAEPRLVLLDEPTAGVNPTLIRTLVDAIREMARRGVRFFLVEHNMPLVSELCGRLLVMDAGRMIFAGPPQEALKDRAVVEAYLGRGPDAA